MLTLGAVEIFMRMALCSGNTLCSTMCMDAYTLTKTRARHTHTDAPTLACKDLLCSNWKIIRKSGDCPFLSSTATNSMSIEQIVAATVPKP